MAMRMRLIGKADLPKEEEEAQYRSLLAQMSGGVPVAAHGSGIGSENLFMEQKSSSDEDVQEETNAL